MSAASSKFCCTVPCKRLLPENNSENGIAKETRGIHAINVLILWNYLKYLKHLDKYEKWNHTRHEAQFKEICEIHFGSDSARTVCSVSYRNQPQIVFGKYSILD